MAVEIPVVVDIEGAFKDAAARVPSASNPLRQSFDKLSQQLSKFKGQMETSDVFSKQFENTARSVMKTEEALDLLIYKMNQLKTNDGSINRLAGDMQLIQQQWARMGSEQMFDSSGKLSADGKKLQQSYAAIATEIDRINALLRQEYDAQVKATREAERQAQAEKAHQAALSMTATSLSELNTKLAAWTAEMNNATPGTQKFRDAAIQVEILSRRITELNGVMKETGQYSTSIDGLNTRLQNLNQQYNALSASDRTGAKGKAIVDEYRKVSRELEKEGKTLQQVIQQEQKRQQIIKNTTNKRKYENAILNSTATTMRVLSEQARILQERLERTAFGTKKYKDLQTQLEGVRQKMQQVQGATTGMNTAFQRQSGILRSLTSYASMYVSVFGFLRFVKQIRDVTGELEYQRVALQNLIQDEEYGAALFERIKAAAIESPFRIKDLVTYTKQLAAYRIAQEDLFDTTQRLADISAGLGVDMNRLILAYGQVRAASVLRGQELRQFTEAGIPLVDLLADKFEELGRQGTTTADVFKLISERAVPFSMIAEIFEDLTDKGGMFYEMQEKQAQTLKGRWEKLKDAFDIGLQSIGESKGILDFYTYNNLLLGVLNALAKNLRVIPKLIEGGTLAWIAYNAALFITGKRTKTVIKDDVELLAMEIALSRGANEVTKSDLRLAAAKLSLSKSTNLLTRSFAKLRIAMLTNPWAFAIASVLGLVAAFLSFRKASDDASKSMSDMEKSIEAMSKANKEFEKTGSLIKRYETLSNKTERTANENLKLAQTMATLREQFPDLIDSIGDENIALQDQVDLLEKARQKRLEDAKEKAREELNIEEEKNRMITESYNNAVNAYNEANKELVLAQARRKKGAAAINALFEGTPTRPYSDKELQDDVDRLTVAADNARVAMEEANDELEKSNKSIARLKNQIDPSTAQKDWAEWQNQIKKLQDGMTKLGDTPAFTDEEIGGFESVYDLSKKLKKRIDDLTTSIKGMKTQLSNMKEKGSNAYNALSGEIAASEKTLEIAEAIRLSLGLIFGKGSSGYTQDPFIKQMQDRIKFMQDFKKGYDDLSKYMAKAGALEKEGGIMLGRGMSLGLSEADQRRAAEDLSNWYTDMINEVSKRLRAKGVRGTSVTDLLGIDTTKRSKDVQDLQKLLQSLWDAKTDFDTSQMKKSIEDALKKLSDEIKRSETARNFYQDILGLTGDEQLAATLGVSIYGDIGKEFNDRLQEELNKALETLDAGSITDELRKAFSTQNFSVILENLDKFPEEWQKRLKEMAASSEKFQADMVKNLLKSLEKLKSYGDQQVELSKQTARRTANIQALNIPQTQKNNLLEQNARKEAEESAKIAYEAFRDTPMYIELFDDLDAASTRMLENMRKNLEDMRENWKALSPRELKELQSKINDLDEQIAKKNPFKALISSIKEYRDLQKVTTRREAESNAITANDEMVRNKEILELYQKQYEESVAKYGIESKEAKQAEKNLKAQAIVTDLAIENAKAAQKTASAFKEAGSRIQKAADGLETWSGYITESLGGIKEIVSTFASDDVAETFGIISDGIGKTVSGATDLAKGIGKILTGDIVGGVVSAIKGAGDFIAGTFGAASQLKIKALDKEIEKQSRLIDDLSYSYSRLENAMAKSFGSEYIYNYNKQLENLEAQAEAYRAQAEAEQSKGKKADEDKVREYLNSARDAEDQIAEMRTQLSEFFSGTDLTSAAEDFANAWIEAYKEFGSTTDAMSEKFNEMINSMINRSLAAKIMQEMLQPIFDQIDTMSRDGLLSTEEIAAIAALAQERIPLINDAMTNLMTSLASAGLDVRASTAGFQGISKDIAGASEESILGLAAAINTQNFYISYVPTISENVSQILAAMTGGVSPTAPVETNEAGEVLPSVQRMVYDHLPNMDANLSEMLRLFRSVITTKTGSTNTNYVAIK